MLLKKHSFEFYVIFEMKKLGKKNLLKIKKARKISLLNKKKCLENW